MLKLDLEMFLFSGGCSLYALTPHYTFFPHLMFFTNLYRIGLCKSIKKTKLKGAVLQLLSCLSCLCLCLCVPIDSDHLCAACEQFSINWLSWQSIFPPWHSNCYGFIRQLQPLLVNNPAMAPSLLIYWETKQNSQKLRKQKQTMSIAIVQLLQCKHPLFSLYSSLFVLF